jgi:hypothetical protein
MQDLGAAFVSAVMAAGVVLVCVLAIACAWWIRKYL